MSKPQIILDDTGQPAFVVIPWRDYERLTNEDAEAILSNVGQWHCGKRPDSADIPPRCSTASTASLVPALEDGQSRGKVKVRRIEPALV